MPPPEPESSVARAATRNRFADHEPISAATAGSASLLTQTLRVYLEDTDAGGIVYHASWLRFFERARTDWLRALGIEQSSLGPATGIGFVVRDMQIAFLRPGRLDQTIRTELRLAEARRQFDETLRLDPQNPQALEFKRQAEAAPVRGVGR